MKEESQQQPAVAFRSAQPGALVTAGHPLTAEEEAILTAVLYSSLFQYPLTCRELRLSLPRVRMSVDEIQRAFSESRTLGRLIEFREGHFFRRGQWATLRLRRLRRRLSLRRLAACQKALRVLTLVPFTRLVALSGSAAHLNMGRSADIDFFIITRGRTVWSVAVLALALSRLLGCRRRICLNYLVSDEDLRLERRDFFTANQVLSLRTLIGADVLPQLLSANPFIRESCPADALEEAEPGWLRDYQPSAFALRMKKTAELLLSLGVIQLFEPFARALYRHRLMGARESWATPDEVRIEKTVLKLHTHSHRARIEKQLLRLLQEAIQKIDE